MDMQHVQYRRYLERVGVIDAVSNALVKLYEDNEKPDNAVLFVRKLLCETCPDDDMFSALRNELEAANRKIALLERDLERLKQLIKPTDEELVLILEEKFKNLNEDENCNSLLRKYLERAVFDELVELKTSPPCESHFLDCVKSGFEYHSAECGIYAADAECYDVFSPLFEPIIRDYHDLPRTEVDGVDSDDEADAEAEEDAAALQPDVDYGELDDIENLDRNRAYIQSTQIRIARNLQGYPYFAKLTERQFSEIESRVWAASEGLDGEHTGAYFTMDDLSMLDQEKMVKRNILFSNDDAILKAAGCYRFWPTGRGLYHNPAETFLIWVNDTDHLQVISVGHHGDLGDVYHRLVIGLQELEKTLTFARHPKYGFLGACPTNLGTALHASVHIRLPLLSQNEISLKQKIADLDLELRSNLAKKSKFDIPVMEIANKAVMGVTEFEIIKKLQDGIKELIRAEEELEAGAGDAECGNVDAMEGNID